MRIPLAENFGQRIAQNPSAPTQTNDGGIGAALGGLDASLQGVAGDLRQQVNEEARQAARDAREAALARDAADKAQAMGALQRNREDLDALQQTFDDDLQTGVIDKTKAVDEFRMRSQKLITSGTADVPDSHRGFVQEDLALRASRLEGKVQRSVTKRDRSDVLAGIDTTLEYAQRLATTEPENAEKIASDVLEQLGPHAGLLPDQIAKKKQATLEGMAYTRAYTGIMTVKADNRSLQAVDKVIAADTRLDPQKKATLLASSAGFQAANSQREEAAAARADREREANLKRAEAEFNTFQGVADKGGALDPDYVAGVVAKTEGTPYQAGIIALAKQSVETGGLAVQPISRQQAELDAVDARIAASGRTAALDKRRGQVEKVLTGSKADLQKDGLQAYVERGGGVAPALDMSNPTTITASISGRVAYAQRASQWAEKPVSPFFDAEASQVKTVLNALPPAQRSVAIGAIAATLPPGMAQAVATQIDKHDRGLALEMAAGDAVTTSGRNTSEWIARGRQAIKDKALKEDSHPMTGLRAQLATELGDALSGKAREDVLDAARFIYLGEQSDANYGPTIKGALRLALNGDLVEHNGRKLPTASGITVDILRDRLGAMTAETLAPQTPDGQVYTSDGRKLPAAQFVSDLPRAVLEPAGTGRYFVRAGAGLALNAKGKPIIIEVR